MNVMAISPSRAGERFQVRVADLEQSRTSPGNLEKNETEFKVVDKLTKGGEASMKVNFPSYPVHGVIGSSHPPWLDAMYTSSKNRMEDSKRQDYRKQKFDFYETYEKKLGEKRNGFPIEPSPIPGLYNLWRKFNNGQRTCDVYTTDPSLPKRFQQPELLRGYGIEKEENPFFTTVSSAYGKFPPTIHDVPREYHAFKNSFTSHLASTGMPKNRSLNIK